MKSLFFLLLISLFLTSCITNSKLYYESPLSGNTIKYLAMPLLKDSLKTANYCNFNVYGGLANDHGFDNSFYSSYHFHQSKTIKRMQFYYGIDFLFGNYNVKPLNELFVKNNNYKKIDIGDQHKSFFSYGFQTGIFYTYSRNKNFEWRVIGAEYSYKKEAGDYLDFRKSLPDSSASINLRDDFIHSLGIATELIFSSKKINWGFKAGYGLILNKSYMNPKYYDYFDISPKKRYDYFLLNTTITYKKYTFNIQGNFGKFTNGISSGLTYRL